MNYAQQQRNPTKHLTGFGVVVLMHVVLVYALLTVGSTVVKFVQKPFKTVIIEEKKEIPKDEPPPPPKILPPPPPFIPPPDINIQIPVIQAAPAITVVKEKPVVAPPPPVVARVPVHVNAVIDANNNCRKPEYPAASLRLEETGTTTLAILVGLDGTVVDSKIQKSSGHDRLDEAARSALSRCKFKPATVDGKPEQTWSSLNYTWRLTN